MKPQIALITLIIILGMGFVAPDTGYEIPDEIIIVRAPRTRLPDRQVTPINPYQEEYERMFYPTVRIMSGFSTGSGVVISYTQIYILTAAHVVEDETTVDIELRRDRASELYNSEIVTGTVVITDTVKDLALIKPTGLVLYSAQLAPRNYTPYIFTPVYSVGCSLGLPPRPSQGIISVVEDDHWEITAPILPGNSGGPVYDGRTYEVIGIAVWVKVYDGQLVTTMAGIVPIQQIHEFLNHR
ncbi:MAG: serine protease [Planctomycetota bacterium]